MDGEGEAEEGRMDEVDEVGFAEALDWGGEGRRDVEGIVHERQIGAGADLVVARGEEVARLSDGTSEVTAIAVVSVPRRANEKRRNAREECMLHRLLLLHEQGERLRIKQVVVGRKGRRQGLE